MIAISANRFTKNIWKQFDWCTFSTCVTILECFQFNHGLKMIIASLSQWWTWKTCQKLRSKLNHSDNFLACGNTILRTVNNNRTSKLFDETSKGQKKWIFIYFLPHIIYVFMCIIFFLLPDNGLYHIHRPNKNHYILLYLPFNGLWLE